MENLTTKIRELEKYHGLSPIESYNIETLDEKISYFAWLNAPENPTDENGVLYS